MVLVRDFKEKADNSPVYIANMALRKAPDPRRCLKNSCKRKIKKGRKGGRERDKNRCSSKIQV